MFILIFVVLTGSNYTPASESSSDPQVTTIHGFLDSESCEETGNKMARLIKGARRTPSFICAPLRKLTPGLN